MILSYPRLIIHIIALACKSEPSNEATKQPRQVKLPLLAVANQFVTFSYQYLGRNVTGGAKVASYSVTHSFGTLLSPISTSQLQGPFLQCIDIIIIAHSMVLGQNGTQCRCCCGSEQFRLETYKTDAMLAHEYF